MVWSENEVVLTPEVNYGNNEAYNCGSVGDEETTKHRVRDFFVGVPQSTDPQRDHHCTSPMIKPPSQSTIERYAQ